MIMAQNEYEKLVRVMADKGVPHWAFELLSDLRSNEVNNSLFTDAIESSICDSLIPHTDYENLAVNHSNYLQVIRKLKERYNKALAEITENHWVDCNCEFCQEFQEY